MLKLKLRFIFILSLLITSFSVFADTAYPKITLTSSTVELVDINKADVKTLAKLKGVGEVKAKAIVNYRKKIGKFTSLEQLKKIKGIGEKVIIENKSKLTI